MYCVATQLGQLISLIISGELSLSFSLVCGPTGKSLLQPNTSQSFVIKGAV